MIDTLSRRVPVVLLLLFLAAASSACGKKQEAAVSTNPPPASVESQPAAAPAAPAPQPAPASAPLPPASSSAIATSDGEKPGTRVEVTELKRGSGGTLSLKFTMINDSDGKIGFGYEFGSPDNHIGDFASIGGVTLVDPVAKKKYFVVRDSESKCVCSSGLHDIEKGSRMNLWAKFPAPPRT